MLKILLPIIAFIAVLAGLIAAESPLTQEQLDQKFAQEKMEQLENEYKQTLDELNELDRDKRSAQLLLKKLNESKDKFPALTESSERIKEELAKQKAESEGKIIDIEAKMLEIEQRAEEWVRIAYKLTPYH